MVRTIRLGIFLLAILMPVSACATTFPQSLLQQVDPSLRFDQLAAAPDEESPSPGHERDKKEEDQ